MAALSTTHYKRTLIKPQGRHVYTEQSKEAIFWDSFDFPITKKEYGPINDVQFSPLEPYQYAVASSTRVQIYSCDTNQVVKSFSKFKDVVHCARYRQDGNLFVAGTDGGLVKVFDIERKLCLRMLKGHKSACHAAQFLRDGYRIITSSDDQTSILWDLATGKKLFTFVEHKDSIRSCVASTVDKDMFLTGSYDGTAKLFDVRSNKCIQSVDHKAPVEDVVMFKSGTVYVTAGGSTVKVWDSLTGGKLLAELTNHHKTVLGLAFSPDYKKLMSASLDRHVKIYDTSSYQVMHTLDFPTSVLCIGISGDERCFAAGMADGMLSVRHKKVDAELTRQEKNRKAFHHQLQRFSFKPSQDAHLIQHRKKEQLSKYDSYLKSFQYSKALDAVLEPKIRLKQPNITASILEELIRRDGIRSAVAGRDEKSLDVLLRFLSRHVTDSHYTKTVTDVINVLLDIYTDNPDRLASVLPRLIALSNVISNEVKYEEQLLQLLGTMDAILSLSNVSIDSGLPMSDIIVQEHSNAVES